MITDIIDREINVGDYVVFHVLIYKVLGLGTPKANGHGQVRMILLDKSDTTKPVVKSSKDLCLIPKGDMLFWLLKKD